MKLIKSLFIIALVGCVSTLTAQMADYYSVPMPNAKGSNYLFYKPDSGFAAITKFDAQVNVSAISPVIKNYGERAVVYAGEGFTLETDRSNALYFKAKNGVREIFLKEYLSDAKCWEKGAVVYAALNDGDKNIIEVFVKNTIYDPKEGDCNSPITQINIETTYADATGKQPASFIEKVAEEVSLVDEKRALLVKLPRKYLTKLVSVNFRMYDMRGKLVKEFINMKAAENIVYINDLRKTKYKYIIEVYDGTLIKEGTITLKK